MTLSEYRSWVEGFIEGIGGGTPNEKQWDKIKTKLLMVEGPPKAAQIPLAAIKMPPISSGGLVRPKRSDEVTWLT